MNNIFLYRPIEILLVEDSPSDAKLTIKQLKAAKVVNHIHWVEEGETAMAFLRRKEPYTNSKRPDLILLDLNLPGLDGREVLSIVKSDPDLKRIPVVILTTSADEADVLKSYNLNANCYVTKPVDIQQFMEVINLLTDFWLAAVRLPPR